MHRVFAGILALGANAGSPASAQQRKRGPAPTAQQGISEPAAALAVYRNALMKRGAAGMFALFAQESLVVENGKVEGAFSDQMEHHLKP